jgi:hypothetical protein
VGSDEEIKEVLFDLQLAVFLERVWVRAQKSFRRDMSDFQ